MGLNPVDQWGFRSRENKVYGVLDGELDQRWEVANTDIDVGDILEVVASAPVSCGSGAIIAISTTRTNHYQEAKNPI